MSLSHLERWVADLFAAGFLGAGLRCGFAFFGTYCFSARWPATGFGFTTGFTAGVAAGGVVEGGVADGGVVGVSGEAVSRAGSVADPTAAGGTVAAGGSAAPSRLNIASASTTPSATSRPGRAVCSSAAATASAVSIGFQENARPATAETCGAAKLVPVHWPGPPSYGARVVPGAASCTHEAPWFEYDASWPF